jgi:hypothetical protein
MPIPTPVLEFSVPFSKKNRMTITWIIGYALNAES